MMLTLLVAVGALLIAAVVSAVLAPSVRVTEQPFLPAQCVTRLRPIAGGLGTPRPS